VESDWGGWAEWGPPITVLVAAIAFGWISVVRMRPGTDPSIERESRKLDLESAKEEAIAALKQLELDKDKLPPDEYERERERLLHRGARALEALENPEVASRLPPEPRDLPPVTRPAPGTPGGGLAPEWRGALYTLGAIVLLFVLWNWAGTIAKPKPEDGMPGQPGDVAQDSLSPRAQQVRDSPVFQQEVAAQEALLQANPSDVGALNQLTYLWLMMAEDPQKAFGYNEQAIQADAKNPDARAYRAVLTAMMGMADKAIASLDELLAEHPDHEKGIIYRAMMLLQLGRTQEGVAALEAAAQKHPESQELQMALAAARQMPPPQQGGPQGSPQGGSSPAAAGERLAAGTLTLDPAAQASLKGGEVLFLSISNPAGGPGTPPVAAQKQPVGSFPVSFELTTADIRAMPGAGGVPDVFDVKARIDTDGNAMTREPGPVAVVTGVSRGATGLTLTLTLDGAPAPGPASNSLLAPLPGAPAAPTGPVELLVSGTAQLDPSFQSALQGTEIVFVSVRDPAGGPPLAVSRVPARFPLQFRVTSADAIQMGAARPIPETFHVSVRIDRDGNAMTKEGEPEALSEGVKKGTSALQLTLQ
jgi:tetratricopeptide (TPR) repeat protein